MAGKKASLLDEEPSDPHNRRLEEVAREVKWEWKRKSLQGHKPTKLRMSLSYNKTIFQHIKLVLTEVGTKELEKQFVDGCFGHLMGFIGGTNCIRALYELIAREINAPEAEDGLWFRVGGTNIRFSPKEYALITGLHFGSSSFDPLGSHELPKDGVCKRCFRGRSMTIGELMEKFNSQSVRDGSPHDYLKVANVLALYLMVLGYDQRKKVENWVWVLVEDLDSWNRFPWGAYAYQALRHFVRSLPTTREGFDTLYYIFGPMWALQIWAYEAIPELGKTCASVARKNTVPRCLKWEYHSKKIVLAPCFFEELQSCSVELDPTNEEKLQPYWASVQTHEPLGVRYAFPQRRCPRRAGTRGTLDESVSWQEQHSSDSDDRARSHSPRGKRTRAATRSHRVLQRFDEARFVDRVSSRVVERLIKQLVPQMKQLIESRQSPSQSHPSREVHDELEMMHETSFMHEKPPCNCAESAKKAERNKEKQSCDGGSSSIMNISRKAGNRQIMGEKTKPVQKDAFDGEEQSEGLDNAPRLDAGVSRGAKSSAVRKDALNHIQTSSNERLKGEQKRMQRTSPHREDDEANIAKKKKSKKNKKLSMSKRMRRSRSPSSSEDDESESTSGSERRRKPKKRSKKKKQRKYSESSSSESSSDRDRHRRKRNRHRRRRSSPSDSEASDSVSP